MIRLRCPLCDRIRLQSVKASNADLLRHLDELGLVPGARIEVKAYSPYDHNLTVKVGRKTTVLGLNITGQIFIEES